MEQVSFAADADASSFVRIRAHRDHFWHILLFERVFTFEVSFNELSDIFGVDDLITAVGYEPKQVFPAVFFKPGRGEHDESLGPPPFKYPILISIGLRLGTRLIELMRPINPRGPLLHLEVFLATHSPLDITSVRLELALGLSGHLPGFLFLRLPEPVPVSGIFHLTEVVLVALAVLAAVVFRLFSF